MLTCLVASWAVMGAAKKQSKREISHTKMLKEALSRPGVRETMEVYEKYRSKQGKIGVASSAVC